MTGKLISSPASTGGAGTDVYGRPLELKRNPDIRKAVLNLLDILVDNGSAAAFRMRDDFVTPVC